MYHHNAKGLVRQFEITISEATAIVRACPICSHHNGGVGLGCGVNPRGTKINEVWQVDVTHLQSFGHLRYIHVAIDTFSGFIWATAQAGEKAVHVIRHFASFLQLWGSLT